MCNNLSYLPTQEAPEPISGAAFVYILACSDGALYIGSTGNVAKPLAEHASDLSKQQHIERPALSKRQRAEWGAKFTRDHPGSRLVYVEGPLTIALGLQRERQLKRWSRAKKLALIQNQIELLKQLSH